MKTYIRFENGKQVEVTTLDTKPSGNNWKIAPKSFDFSKRYRLTATDSVEEIPQEVLQTEQLELAKETALVELSRLVDIARSVYVGISPAKQKCYEIQEKAANAVIDVPETSLGLVIKPLADVRNISVLEMAELILEKTVIANRKIIEAEALEDEYQSLIANTDSFSKIDDLLAEASTRLADGPLPEDF